MGLNSKTRQPRGIGKRLQQPKPPRKQRPEDLQKRLARR
jgi:hypothetical protein